MYLSLLHPYYTYCNALHNHALENSTPHNMIHYNTYILYDYLRKTYTSLVYTIYNYIHASLTLNHIPYIYPIPNTTKHSQLHLPENILDTSSGYFLTHMTFQTAELDDKEPYRHCFLYKNLSLWHFRLKYPQFLLREFIKGVSKLKSLKVLENPQKSLKILKSPWIFSKVLFCFWGVFNNLWS